MYEASELDERNVEQEPTAGSGQKNLAVFPLAIILREFFIKKIRKRRYNTSHSQLLYNLNIIDSRLRTQQDCALSNPILA